MLQDKDKLVNPDSLSRKEIPSQRRKVFEMIRKTKKEMTPTYHALLVRFSLIEESLPFGEAYAAWLRVSRDCASRKPGTV
jgi:hypothetical protein